MKAAMIVMAKTPVPGRVKTRLIGRWTAAGAARVHAAMTECVLHRVRANCEAALVLALEGGASAWAGFAAAVGADLPSPEAVVDQGGGDLGQRMARVWQAVGSGRVAFLGTDSPDVPVEWLRAATAELARAEALIGPTEDGGYWTLAARAYRPGLLRGIDWGTPGVYHQTCEAARAEAVRLASLPRWMDVDEPDDLDALDRRLDRTTDRHLRRLRRRLAQAALHQDEAHHER